MIKEYYCNEVENFQKNKREIIPPVPECTEEDAAYQKHGVEERLRELDVPRVLAYQIHLKRMEWILLAS